MLRAPWQGLNNAVALDFDYRQQMIYWTDVTTQGSMIRRMYINGSDVQVSLKAGGEKTQLVCSFLFFLSVFISLTMPV